MTKRECLVAVAREFSGVHNFPANLIGNALLDDYSEIHSAVLVPQTLTPDGEEYTWVGSATEDPDDDLTRWRGRPAEIIDADGNAFVQVRADEIIRRRGQYAADYTDRAYAVNFRGDLCRAYAVGQGNKIMLVTALTAGTVLTIYHYQTPTPLTSNSAIVQLPDDFTDVLTLKTIWSVGRFLANRSVPGFTETRVREYESRYRERFDEMRAWLNSDENIEHIRTGGQMVRLTNSLTTEFLRAVE